MGGWKPPEFSSEGFCAVLVKLGFVEKRKARHGRLFGHPKRTGTGRMPFMVVPSSLRNDRQFQKALVRDLIRYWDFTLDEIKKAFK